MESYVVRIYRRSPRRPRILVGTVEMVGSEGKAAFSNAEELWEILESRGGQTASAPPPEPGDQPGKEV